MGKHKRTVYVEIPYTRQEVDDHRASLRIVRDWCEITSTTVAFITSDYVRVKAEIVDEWRGFAVLAVCGGAA